MYKTFGTIIEPRTHEKKEEILEKNIIKKRISWLKKHVAPIAVVVGLFISLVFATIYVAFFTNKTTESLILVFICLISVFPFAYFIFFICDNLTIISSGLKALNRVKTLIEEEKISPQITSIKKDECYVWISYEYDEEEYEYKLKYSDIKYDADIKESTIIIDDDLQVICLVNKDLERFL